MDSMFVRRPNSANMYTGFVLMLTQITWCNFLVNNSMELQL